MSRIASVAGAAFAVTLMGGCSSQISAIFNRDLRTDTVSFGQTDSYVIVSTTGERRMSFFAKDGRMCPENFPDVGRALNAKTDIQATPPGTSSAARLTDQFETNLTVTNQRSEAADIIGRMGAIICVAYLNGAITPSEYRAMVDRLLQGSLMRVQQAAPPGSAGKK
jgi:hypothetical protein